MLDMVGLTSRAALASPLTKLSWAVSNSQTGSTAVTYSYSFTTATTATLTAVTMTVPAGTGGSVASGTVYGLGAGTVVLSGTALTYTITSPVSVAAGIPMSVSFTGLTNTSTAGAHTSMITAQESGPTTVDSGASGSVTFGSSSIGVTATVSQSLALNNKTPSFSWALDPSTANLLQSHAVVLTVLTNAAGGYTLATSDAGLSRSSPTFTIPAVSTTPKTGVASVPSSGWEASATLGTGGTDGAALTAGLSGGKFVRYPSTARNLMTATGPTGATPDTLTLTDHAGVNDTVPHGTYSDTTTYVATPNF
jgi:hypothetical protein